DAHAEQRRRNRHRVFAAAIIHENDFIHNPLLKNFINGLGDGQGRVVGRHHHDNFFPEIHGLPKFWLILPESFQVLKPNLKYQLRHGGRWPPTVKPWISSCTDAAWTNTAWTNSNPP